MDYKQEAEKRLKNYSKLLRAKENLEKDIMRLNISRTSNNLTQKLDPTGIRGSSNDQDAYNQIYEWTQLRANLTETEETIKDIDYNLKFLNSQPGCERYGDLLRMWYIDKLDRLNIADELVYSMPQLYRKKDEALKEFSIILWGIKAVI